MAIASTYRGSDTSALYVEPAHFAAFISPGWNSYPGSIIFSQVFL